jgi:carbamoyltransferase
MSYRTSRLTVLGLSGGFSPTRHAPDASRRAWWNPKEVHWRHDSAAVLVADGRIVAAIEEERLNRIKHTNRLAHHGIAACLELGGLTIDDVTHIAYYGREDDVDAWLAGYLIRNPDVPWRSARECLAEAFSYDLETEIDPAQIVFVEHHRAHAASAYSVGPFSDALVVTLDGFGDGVSGTVWAGERGQLNRLLDLSHRNSLGELYVYVIRYLGYEGFDEYKVMGLAAYGDPSRYRHVFDHICVLQPEGRYQVRATEFARLREVVPTPRRSGTPLTDVHRDVAAALQEAIERAAFHLLEHYRGETGLRHLCLAGGVAHNSTMIGKIARSGLFDGVFVQPASHDAGCALGAAVDAHRQLKPDVPIARMSDVYLGRPLGDGATVATQLARWADLVDTVRLPDVAATVAELLDGGAVIGWVQGRSEFGPRALGNRSILADARPAANKDRINALVKERESYRPFAPAVLEEYADAFFDMPRGIGGGFMTFTVPVKAHVRDVLGAVTHVDGTARVQTVSRATNERFWALLDAFRQRSGVPVLLNTSFNHSVEPIVDSLDDAMTCFLTTGLTHLVLDNYLVTKRPQQGSLVWHLVPHLPEYVRITHAVEGDVTGEARETHRCEHVMRPRLTRQLTPAVYRSLACADQRKTLGELVAADLPPLQLQALAAEFEDLWTHRLLRLLPPTSTACGSSVPGVAAVAISR